MLHQGYCDRNSSLDLDIHPSLLCHILASVVLVLGHIVCQELEVCLLMSENACTKPSACLWLWKCCVRLPALDFRWVWNHQALNTIGYNWTPSLTLNSKHFLLNMCFQKFWQFLHVSDFATFTEWLPHVFEKQFETHYIDQCSWRVTSSLSFIATYLPTNSSWFFFTFMARWLEINP